MGGETGTTPSPSPAPRSSAFRALPTTALAERLRWSCSPGPRSSATSSPPACLPTIRSSWWRSPPGRPYLAAAAGHVPFVAFVAVAAPPPVRRRPVPLPARPAPRRRWRRRGELRRRPGRAGTDGRSPWPLRAGPSRGSRLGLVVVALSPSGKVLVLAGASRRLPIGGWRRPRWRARSPSRAPLQRRECGGRDRQRPWRRGMAAFTPIMIVATAASWPRLRHRRATADRRSARLAAGHGCDELQAPAEDLLEQRPLAAGTPQLHLQVAGAGHVDSHP